MDKFQFVMPAELTKGADDGEWKVRGLASTETVDQQGETIVQKGIDLTPIEKKKGILNWDHLKGPENTIGVLDGYQRGGNGLYIEGRLFKNHTKAKAVKEIMDSLGEGDRGRMGLSVEGQILERDPQNPKIIKKCRINAVALTMNPVNSGTYADFVKSMTAGDVEFKAEESTASEDYNGEVTFTATQVMEMVQKALSMGAPGTQAPVDRSGGDALAKESMDKDDKKKKVKKKKMKKMDKCMYKSNIMTALDKIQVMYPDMTRSQLWEALKSRLQETFPDINEQFGKGRGPDKNPRKRRGTTLDGLVSDKTKQKMRQVAEDPRSSKEIIKDKIKELETKQYNSQSGLTQKQIEGKLKNLRSQLKNMN